MPINIDPSDLEVLSILQKALDDESYRKELLDSSSGVTRSLTASQSSQLMNLTEADFTRLSELKNMFAETCFCNGK